MNNQIEYFKCPCCGYETLRSYASFETCYLDDWEDDGQGDHNADQPNGGPNGNYSLTEARNNFKKYYTMYRPSDRRFFQSEDEIVIKKQIIEMFSQVTPSEESDPNKLRQLNKLIGALINRQNQRIREGK